VNAVTDFLEQCADAVLKGDRDTASRLAREALDRRLDPVEVVEKGFAVGIREAGRLWEAGDYFLPELAFSAEAMKAAVELLSPALGGTSPHTTAKGTVIIGTIQGDIHDIGKTLVGTMLAASGYRVVDLGADVAYDRFVDEARNEAADLVCMSALLTTTMVGQKEVIRLLREAGLRDRVRVLVGGAPTSAEWAGEIGADGHADNAVEAVHVADQLLAS
jgi:corrinoid protein of di/trimethylamine methyltransferase